MIIKSEREKLEIVRGWAFRNHDDKLNASIRLFLKTGDTENLKHTIYYRKEWNEDR